LASRRESWGGLSRCMKKCHYSQMLSSNRIDLTHTRKLPTLLSQSRRRSMEVGRSGIDATTCQRSHSKAGSVLLRIRTVLQEKGRVVGRSSSATRDLVKLGRRARRGSYQFCMPHQGFSNVIQAIIRVSEQTVFSKPSNVCSGPSGISLRAHDRLRAKLARTSTWPDSSRIDGLDIWILSQPSRRN
jgi:hypothetical protein